MDSLMHLLHYDALLHWCALIALALFVIGAAWVALRVLLPLRRLACAVAEIERGYFPDFSQPVGGIAEIERLRRALHTLSAQVSAAQAEEAVLRRRLSESREEERRRIARDIHDDAIQMLVVVGHDIDRAAAGLPTCPDQAAGCLKQARAHLTQAVDVLRQMIGALRPALLEHLGLEAALRHLCKHTPEVHLTIAGHAEPITQAHELAVYRAAQEAIQNARRHACASQIHIALKWSCSGVALDVHDDGVGFAVPSHLYALAREGHFGLLGLREQITALGGMLAVDSAPGHGTHVRAWLPAFPPPDDGALSPA
jgi:two-component system sensor histidine kinase UhpB